MSNDDPLSFDDIAAALLFTTAPSDRALEGWRPGGGVPRAVERAGFEADAAEMRARRLGVATG